MAPRASYSHAYLDGTLADRSYDQSYDDVADELYAGDPIYTPPRRRSSFVSAILTLAVLGGGGYAALETKALWQPLLPHDLSALRAMLAPQAPPAPDPMAVASAMPAVQQPLAAREIAEAPSVAAGTPIPSAPTEEPSKTEEDAAPAKANADDAPAAPLPPPVIDSSDPYQKRALSVGLDPGLSRVLLARMSAADYKNADAAIRKAIAETPDGDVLVWPQGKKQGVALFEVKFVKSAAPDCRRYVVTVTMDRWSTTAQPMEKCGLSPPARHNS